MSRYSEINPDITDYRGRWQPTVTPALEEVTDVHDDSILERRSWYKFALFVGILDLERIKLCKEIKSWHHTSRPPQSSWKSIVRVGQSLWAGILVEDWPSRFAAGTEG